MSVVLVTITFGNHRSDVRLDAVAPVAEVVNELVSVDVGLQLPRGTPPRGWELLLARVPLDRVRSLTDQHVLDGMVLELRPA